MFGKKKPQADGENTLPEIGAENSRIDDVLAGVGSDSANLPITPDDKSLPKPKKKLFGMFQKKSADAGPTPADPESDLDPVRVTKTGDPLSFLDPEAVKHDIVIKEITENLDGQKKSPPAADKDLVATVLDSAQPQSVKDASMEPIPEDPEDNVLANAAELTKNSSKSSDSSKAKSTDQDNPLSEQTSTSGAAQSDEADAQSDNAMPERNMNSLYKSMGLDESLSPDYDPTAKNEPQFVTEGQSGDGEPSPPQKKKSGLVSAIVQTTKKNQAEQNAVLGEEITEQLSKEEEEAQLKAKAKKREKLLLASRFVAGLSLIVPLFSWVILSSLLTPDSRFSDILNSRNYGAELAGVKAKREEKDVALKKLNGEIAKLQQDTENIKDNKILKQVIDERIDFLEIMLRINKITLKALNLTPELNNAIHMLVFNSYTGRIDKGKNNVQVSITGSVRDPKRLSISKLTQLIEAINADEYFEGAALRSFSKSNDEEGGSQSSFSLSFTYFPDADKALNDSLASAPKK